MFPREGEGERERGGKGTHIHTHLIWYSDDDDDNDDDADDAISRLEEPLGKENDVKDDDKIKRRQLDPLTTNERATEVSHS